MANPNPQNKFQKGNKLGRKPGQPNLITKDIKTLRNFGSIASSNAASTAGDHPLAIIACRRSSTVS